MSWEDSKPEPRACPCGKGKYTVTHRSDDWNRFDERWSMLCPRCKADYGLHSYATNRKGIAETHYGWVPKRPLDELAELVKRRDDESRKLAVLLVSRYASSWHEHFKRMSKREIWTELTNDGRNYPSLATFYSHVRQLGLEKVLNRYLVYREVETVGRVLKFSASELDSITKHLRALEQAIEKKSTEVHRQLVT